MNISIEALEILQKIYELSTSPEPPTTKPVFIEKLINYTKDYNLTNKYLDELYSANCINYKHNDKEFLSNFDIKKIISQKGLNEIGISNIDVYGIVSVYEQLLNCIKEYEKLIKRFKIEIDNVESPPRKAYIKSIVEIKPNISNLVDKIPIDDINFLNENSIFLNNELALFKKIEKLAKKIDFKNIDSRTIKEVHQLLREEREIFQESGILEKINSNKKTNKKIPNNKEINVATFQGIIGQVCGSYININNGFNKQTLEKGFTVRGGIKVLRGYAKSSELAKFSSPDMSYQRHEFDEHLASIREFIKNTRTSAKYLPEVTLVTRDYINLEKIKISGSLSAKQRGEIDNLDYYKLTVTDGQLFRIDGNHRLQALEENDYYISFSIILWENTETSVDDEAFLFYFLNGKSKQLTTEENLKGLVNASTWSDDELASANVALPFLKRFEAEFEKNKLFDKEYYKNNRDEYNGKIQILNILQLIAEENEDKKIPFDFDIFDEYIKKMQQVLLQKSEFKYLRDKFKNFPQLIFYALYKNNGDENKVIAFLQKMNRWAKFYKHDSNSFICPNKMYHNAYKQLRKQINIFVAMPYYDKDAVEQFNKTFQSLINEIENEDKTLENKLNLYPIMTYKAESIDILANMDRQIGECDIFIADISNHGKNKVNPNVMFELGRAYDNKKFILIRNKDNEKTDSAFDIQHIDYTQIDFGISFDTSIKTNLKPRIVNLIKSIIGIC